MARRVGPTVKFMIEALRKAGCAVDKRFFRVETCEGSVVGGFRPPDGVRLRCRMRCPNPPLSLQRGSAHARVRPSQVVMCHNTMQSATEFENMLVHELVHAYDHCRGTDLSWDNCRHHACSEARSGAACALAARCCARRA